METACRMCMIPSIHRVGAESISYHFNHSAVVLRASMRPLAAGLAAFFFSLGYYRFAIRELIRASIYQFLHEAVDATTGTGKSPHFNRKPYNKFEKGGATRQEN